MHLVYVWASHAHALPEGLSWPLLIGAGYGAVRLVRDAIEAVIRFYQRDQALTQLIAKLREEASETDDD